MKKKHHRNQQTAQREINPAELPRGAGSLSPKAGLVTDRVVNPGPALPWRSYRVRNNTAAQKKVHGQLTNARLNLHHCLLNLHIPTTKTSV